MEIFKTFTLECAHRLPNVAAGHKCARVHGHSFRVEVHVAGPVDPTLGWVMDFADLKRAGFNMRKPPVFHRVGIPGSGGPDWLRNDYELAAYDRLSMNFGKWDLINTYADKDGKAKLTAETESPATPRRTVAL